MTFSRLCRPAVQGRGERVFTGERTREDAGAPPPQGAPGEGTEVSDNKEEDQPAKRRKRRKRKEKAEDPDNTEDKDLPEIAEKESPVKKESPKKAETPETPTEEAKKIPETDPRLPLPRRPAKPTEPKEKKSREGATSSSSKLDLRPKVKAERKRSSSRSREVKKKEKARERSPSPPSRAAEGGRRASLPEVTKEEEEEIEDVVEAPPGEWEEERTPIKRPRSPDHPPPLPRRPSRGQLWIGPIRAFKNKKKPKRNKGIKKTLKNERRRQQLWEERAQSYSYSR